MKKLLLSILFLLCLIINSYAKEKIEPSFDCKKKLSHLLTVKKPVQK